MSVSVDVAWCRASTMSSSKWTGKRQPRLCGQVVVHALPTTGGWWWRTTLVGGWWWSVVGKEQPMMGCG